MTCGILPRGRCAVKPHNRQPPLSLSARGPGFLAQIQAGGRRDRFDRRWRRRGDPESPAVRRHLARTL